jgi:hypothetical protein
MKIFCKCFQTVLSTNRTMSAQQVCNSSPDKDSVVLYQINNIETDKNNKCFRKHGIYISTTGFTLYKHLFFIYKGLGWRMVSVVDQLLIPSIKSLSNGSRPILAWVLRFPLCKVGDFTGKLILLSWITLIKTCCGH